jgi:prevent-host-death family protein
MAMERVGICEAKAKLSDLVDRVGKGDEVTITRHDKAVAKLVPVRASA